MQISRLHRLVRDGEFSIRFVSADGEVIEVSRCTCTSWYSSGQTLNIKLCESAEIRKVNRYTIIEINKEEMHL